MGNHKLRIHGWQIGGNIGVFAFILAISEVIEFLNLHYFSYCGLRWEGMPTLLEFFWKLAWKLINNIYIGKRERGLSFFQTPFIG